MAKFVLALLVAYAGWRLWKDALGYKPKRRPGPPVTNDDRRPAARATLGVGPAADEAEIRAAHRRLMSEAHPDHGGSEARARELNAARDLLIGRTG
ncbi:DnaJ domain-containing protein [Sphingomonas sp. TX0543]|uniref:DnaJ domain-containing protein n=1 Tax=unclassified Sphingomonas TaxID=196159 RepID=UPI0020165AB7|nr:DnaJ domain-containing protein [Sphingomonas sp. 3P27F8]